MYVVKHYVAQGQNIFRAWRASLKDTRAMQNIDRRVARLETGNFGDHKYCRDGVWELRIDVGPGYRVYYAHADKAIVLLLCAGDKRTQNADITTACLYWQDWQLSNKKQE
jgi:putative addiction module killer protein